MRMAGIVVQIVLYQSACCPRHMLALVGRAILPAAGFQPACLARSIDKKPPEKAAAARIGCPTSSGRVDYSIKEYLDDVLASALP
jgi:hypothetical protein